MESWHHDAVRHKVADLDGPVHYLDFGGSGPALLMVHGLGGSGLNWMAVGDELARRHRTLAIDLAGFGQTPLFGRSATVGANAHLVHDFIARVIGEPVVLTGNSMGGHIGVLEAAAHPEWVAALVLVDPAVPGVHLHRPPPVMLGAMAALSVPGLANLILDRRLKRLGAEGMVQVTLAMVCAEPARLDPAIVAAHVELTRERQHLGRQNARAFVQASRSIALRIADPRFWSRVAAVKAPTLLIHGSLDRLIPLAAAKELARRRPDWELRVLDGVGHVPMMETPELFLRTVTAWEAARIPSEPAAAS